MLAFTQNNPMQSKMLERSRESRARNSLGSIPRAT